MADQPRDRVALLSIHPRFAEAIAEGSKRVEFRRSVYPARASHVAVYATAPTKAVVAVFAVDGVRSAAPAVLWEDLGSVGAISKDEFNAYYDGADCGNAILIGEVRTLPPVRLAELSEGLHPPQSMCYLSDATADRLLEQVGFAWSPCLGPPEERLQ